MTKRETFTLLALIHVYYEKFEVTQEKIDVWHKALKDHTYEELEQNLIRHVKESLTPPKIAHLTKNTTPTDRFVPDFEETQKIFIHTEKPADEAVVQEELRKMRIILGLEHDR